jgi:branched-chain amino acid transport system substrate-binding protein
LLAAAPDAIVVIAFDETKTIVPELFSQFDAENVYFVDGNLANYSEDFPAGTLTGVKGTLPGLDIDSIADFTTRMNENWVAEGNDDLAGVFAYGPESYDAVVLLALAALAAGSTDAAAIAGKLCRSVTGGSTVDGTKCFSFAECAELINSGGASVTHPLGVVLDLLVCRTSVTALARPSTCSSTTLTTRLVTRSTSSPSKEVQHLRSG